MKTKLSTGVPQVTCDSHTDFKVKRSKVKVTGSISTPQRAKCANISQTDKATPFKFGTHIGRGQLLPRTTNWPEIGLRSAGAAAYCGGHLAAQLVNCHFTLSSGQTVQFLEFLQENYKLCIG